MGIYFDKYIDISKVTLWADSNTENKARLVFGFRDGNPRITVYTGITGKEGVISFPSDIPTMVYILNLIKEVAKAEPGYKQQVQSLTTVYVDNKPTNDKKVLSTLFIGKSKEGIVYISLIMEDKPKIVFPIKPSPYHVFKDGEGNFIDDKILSEKLAISIADVMLNVIGTFIVDITEDEYTSKRKPTLIKGRISNELSVEELDNLSI